jgi:hypothetical protein
MRILIASNKAIREVSGALGVAVRASVCSDPASHRSGQAFLDGLVPAVWVGAAVLADGALLALLVLAAAAGSDGPGPPARPRCSSGGAG